ncbi:uncharacterized protein LOC121877235 [Homarus americanus]|uniref:uncharacterized protein LOC121877235 n=1 Tax=Homarus americanus TaxID=6706 RepID=UPI001C46570F|nr:uncharacterized protein LOC121877235 [Homarus americanus]
MGQVTPTYRQNSYIENVIVVTGCRTWKANILVKTFWGNFVVGCILLSALSIQVAEGSSPARVPESLALSRSSNRVHVDKREAQVTGQDEKVGSHSSPGETDTRSAEAPPQKEAGMNHVTTEGKKSTVLTTEDGTGAEGQTLQTENTNDKTGSADKESPDETNSEAADEQTPITGLKGISSGAVLRGFYVFVAVGTFVLVCIVIKLLRLRRRRASRKYRVLSHNDDQEMFPLAADDGDDEEIFNAADHQTLK